MRMMSLAVFGLMFASTSLAAVRYDYIGQPISNSVSGLLAPGDRIQAFFILNDFAPSGSFSATNFLDYGVRVGRFSLSKATGADVGATLIFGASNNLISWSFVVGKYSKPYANPSLVEAWLNSPDLPPGLDSLTVHLDGRVALGATATSGTWFHQTAPVVPASIRVSEAELCWWSESNRIYQVEYRSSLTTNTWLPLWSNIVGNGEELCVKDTVTRGQPQRFYRVLSPINEGQRR